MENHEAHVDKIINWLFANTLGDKFMILSSSKTTISMKKGLLRNNVRQSDQPPRKNTSYTGSSPF